MTVRLVLYAILVAVMTVSWASTCVIYRAAELGDLLAPMEIRHSGNLDAVVVGSSVAESSSEPHAAREPRAASTATVARGRVSMAPIVGERPRSSAHGPRPATDAGDLPPPPTSSRRG